MGKIITVENLVKSYGAHKAVRGTSFYLEEGALFALLGENGAGKSTTIDILSTLLKPDGGNVKVGGCILGKEDDAIRRQIGIVFQKSVLDNCLTVRENLMIRGGFYKMKKTLISEKIEELANSLDLQNFIDQQYGKLSGGQRRRADIARALIHTPKILFLDEPTTGLDPASRKAIWNTVRQLQKKSGTTVLLTTHYMEEAAGADYVIVMGKGEVLAKGTPPELKTRYTSDILRLEAADTTKMEAALTGDKIPFSREGNRLTIPLTNTLEAVQLLERYGKGITSFEVLQGTLEDAFLQIIGSGLSEEFTHQEAEVA